MFRRSRWCSQPRKLVSIGGWCGPALSLGKLGLRTEAYPFDFSRVTLDGVTNFVTHGFRDGFYPPGRPGAFQPECVGIWVLFRGQHTAFAHFDLNSAAVRRGFDRKMARWNDILDGTQTLAALDSAGDGPPEQAGLRCAGAPAPGQTGRGTAPVHFLRTVAARDAREELVEVPRFEAALQARNPQLDYRLSVVVHDQGLTDTTMLAPLSLRAALWALQYTHDDAHTLFDRSQAGYATVVAHALDDTQWPPRPSAVPQFTAERQAELAAEATKGGAAASGDVVIGNTAATFPWRCHDNIALIAGVASVGGTCTGIGSTRASRGPAADELGTRLTCAACGNTDWHKANAPHQGTDTRPFTEDEDALLLVHLYSVLTGGDKVEAVEALAHEMGRGAFEVICRLQFLTNASTKITEGLGVEPVES